MISRNMKRLFLLEFNELCPSLMHGFMEQGLLPNFKRLYDQSTVYVTDAGEEYPNLEPWIQWLTVHSGMPFRQHKAFDLGSGRDLGEKCIAELLSDAGFRVGVCCSMNTNYQKLNGYYIPDPWDIQGKPSPEWLAPFYQTVAGQVQESSKNAELNTREKMRLGMFMLRNGISSHSFQAILQQLWQERKQPELRWKRPVVLDTLEYDVFHHLNRKFDVQFASLFLNSTAHFQHYYWRNMQPEKFEYPPLESDHESLSGAIRYGYEKMDEIVGRVLKDYPDDVILLSTALSQKAWTDTTKCTFRPRSFDEFLRFAGISPDAVEVKPVMAEEFSISFRTEHEAENACASFSALTISGETLMKIRKDGLNLFAGCAVTDVRMSRELILRDSEQTEYKLDELFNLVHSMRSGRHHPEGILWIRNGDHAVVQEPVPLTIIAPTILDHFGVSPPEYMQHESLFGQNRFAAT